MKRTIAIVIGSALVLGGAWFAISQGVSDISINDLTPGDPSFQQPLTDSEDSELTIVSFNIRDIRGTERTLEDFQELARLIEGADIVVFQEMGAKGFKSSGSNDDLMARLHAATVVMEDLMGGDWTFVFAENATPETMGAGAEIPCIGYRTSRLGLSLQASWSGYYDLGAARDMGLFSVTCTSGGTSENFTIGTVHTKPTCPGRGEELLKVADYIDAHENDNYILMGDFNWGYYSTCTNKYDGEERIEQQHLDGKIFQVFHAISYTGKGNEENFRTNLDVRNVPQMYDQFLLCKNYADKLADGGSLGEDCGFISFSTNDYFQSRIDDMVNEQLKGVKAYMKTLGYAYSSDETNEALAAAETQIRSSYLIEDEASFKMSDHKPIWMRIQLFD